MRLGRAKADVAAAAAQHDDIKIRHGWRALLPANQKSWSGGATGSAQCSAPTIAEGTSGEPMMTTAPKSATTR